MRTELGALALLLASGLASVGDAAANDAVHVVRLRLPKVALYEQPNGPKVDELGSDALAEPWPVAERLGNGFLSVDTPKGRFWVKQYAVQTDEKLVAPAECGVVVTGPERRAGATRGLGEECRQ